MRRTLCAELCKTVNCLSQDLVSISATRIDDVKKKDYEQGCRRRKKYRRGDKVEKKGAQKENTGWRRRCGEENKGEGE